MFFHIIIKIRGKYNFLENCPDELKEVEARCADGVNKSGGLDAIIPNMAMGREKLYKVHLFNYSNIKSRG